MEDLLVSKMIEELQELQKKVGDVDVYVITVACGYVSYTTQLTVDEGKKYVGVPEDSIVIES